MTVATANILHVRVHYMYSYTQKHSVQNQNGKKLKLVQHGSLYYTLGRHNYFLLHHHPKQLLIPDQYMEHNKYGTANSLSNASVHPTRNFVAPKQTLKHIRSMIYSITSRSDKPISRSHENACGTMMWLQCRNDMTACWDSALESRLISSVNVHRTQALPTLARTLQAQQSFHDWPHSPVPMEMPGETDYSSHVTEPPRSECKLFRSLSRCWLHLEITGSQVH